MAENKVGNKGAEYRSGPARNGKGAERLHAGALADELRLIAKRWRFPEIPELQKMRTQGAEGSQERLAGVEAYADTLRKIYTLAEREYGPQVEFIAISVLLMSALNLELGDHQHAKNLIDSAITQVSIATVDGNERYMAMKEDLERLRALLNLWEL
jgi:hypothetical protein